MVRDDGPRPWSATMVRGRLASRSDGTRLSRPCRGIAIACKMATGHDVNHGWTPMTLRRPALQMFSAAALVACSSLAATPARAQPAEEFFTNKRELFFITSSNVGGGYDSYSRLLSRHMSKYLPGNPRFVVQNMLGGGGVRATNFIYNVAPKDGSTIALVDRGMPTAPLLFGDRSQTKFEAQKFTWVGSLMRET